ncbi:pIX [Guinea pig adenovirus 1]|uniref:PIX n=1 Tax=Guinea pig adenovirus 1 TaxID=2847100 RepID=A0AC61M033_9ADEN|nr:pIX [Guinea pig adenovirus]QIZ64147.1 pIX [Guinea pig adenovirus 1]
MATGAQTLWTVNPPPGPYGTVYSYCTLARLPGWAAERYGVPGSTIDGRLILPGENANSPFVGVRGRAFVSPEATGGLTAVVGGANEN